MPRPFYVGKGKQKRIKFDKRNSKHTFVRKQYGYSREIVLVSEEEQECFLKEIELIAIHHTYYLDPEASDIACNFTMGGEGISGWHHKEETILLMKSHERTIEHCENISKVRKEAALPKLQGHKQSPETIRKRLETFVANKALHKSKKGKTRNKLNRQMADEIRQRLVIGESLWDLARKFDVSDTTIRNIRKGLIYAK
jgi:hypothetical protein